MNEGKRSLNLFFSKNTFLGSFNNIKKLPNQDLETQKLGDNGKDRVQAAEMWSKKHLTPEGYGSFAKLASTAEGVKVIEELMKLNKDSSMPVQNTQMDISASADDLKSMLDQIIGES